MNIVNGIRAYIEDNELKITIFDNKINILNYSDIGHFDANKVVVKTKLKDIIIKGNNLVVSKLLKDEILISGEFNNIEFR